MKITIRPLFTAFFFMVIFSDAALAANCSCISFFENKPKPGWVSAEKITNSNYLTYGSTYCTGLQKVDVNRADKAAIANLTRMIKAQVTSTQKIKQRNYGNGVVHSQLTENTSIDTNLMLNGSYIYDHWLDPKSCTIFSATQIDISEIEKAILDNKTREAAKLVNQHYSVSSSSYAIVKPYIESELSGVNIKFSSESHALIIKNRLFNVTEKSGKLVKLMLELEIYDPRANQSIWKKSYSGKGLSFDVTEKEQLVDKALKSALKNALKDLKPFILQNNR